MKVANSFTWMWKYLNKHPFKTVFVTVTAIIEPVFYLIPLFISADIVGILVAGGQWSEIWQLFKILIPLTIFQVILFFVSSYLNEVLAHRITTDMTFDLFEALQDKSLTYHDSKDIGKIMAHATNDTRAVNMGLSPGLRLILAFVSFWLVGLIILATIKLVLFFIAILVLILFVITTRIYGKTLEPISTKVLVELSDISSLTTDSVSGIRDIKSYNAEKQFSNKFNRLAIKQAITKEREGVFGAWYYPNLLLKIFILSVIGYGLYLSYIGELSIRDLVLLATLMAVVGGMSEEMGWVAFVMVGSLAAINRLHKFILEEDHYHIPDGDHSFHDVIASIEFRDVNFTYANQTHAALEGVSFKINDLETLAIVGSPGSGKSTLTKLIQRLYVPQKGKILIGSRSLSEFSNKSLREGIATVEQEVFLFNDTIIENIRFGKPHSPKEEVIRAARIARADEFIQSFPNGYETIIGEDGIRLSGGQAQRLAIARALLLDPIVLIFDDGASALDAETEANIQKAISNILKTRTTIITTHRLSIIAKADKILILDKGNIVGFGSHEVLIKANSYYRQLFEKHFELPPMITEEHFHD